MRGDFVDGGGVFCAKIGDGLETWNEPSRQPFHFQIAASLTFQPPARLDPVEIAIDIKLEHRRRMISRPAGRCRGDAIEPQLAQFPRRYEHTDRPTALPLPHPPTKPFPPQRPLLHI